MTSKHPARRWQFTLLGLALVLCMPAALAGGARGPAPAPTPLSLWRVSDHAGRVLYLAGSMHALTKNDMPLPGAYTRAFDHSDKLVEELNLPKLDEAAVSRQALQMGTLKGTSLSKVMGKEQWAKARKLASRANIELDRYENFKPWLAAVGIADTLLVRLGYNPRLGVDMHFAQLAEKRKMPSSGLETVAEQFSFFNNMNQDVQKRFLLQTLEQATTAKRDLARLHDAWAVGDVHTLEMLQKNNFNGFPHVRKVLLADRNARWMPHLKKCLASGRTCFVVVGVEHMVGPHGLVARFRAAGDTVVQMHAMPGTGTGKD